MARSRITAVHPGLYLKEMLKELGLSQYRLAQEIKVPAMRISHVVRGKRAVSAGLRCASAAISAKARATG